MLCWLKHNTLPPPLNTLPPNVVTFPPTEGGGGSRSDGSPPGGGGVHNTMVALKLQQFQYYLKKIFLRRLWRLVFPRLLGGSDAFKGGGGTLL